LNGVTNLEPGANRDAAATTDIPGKAEPAEFKMPRGMELQVATKDQCLKVINTDLLRSSESGSRSCVYGEDETLHELVTSIESLGIIEPIVVRQVEDAAFLVVAGARRLAAARLLKLRQVPCVVMQCSDTEALVISLTENLQRSDLDPIEKACALQRLLEDFELTQEEIGRRVGMSQSTIAHYLRLLTLPREVRLMISEGALSMGHGKVLAGMDDEHRVIDAALHCISKKKTVREFEAWVAGARIKGDERTSRESLKNKREERELRNGLFLVIKERRAQAGSGTIEIPYYTADEKAWVLEALAEKGMRHGAPHGDAKPSTTPGAQIVAATLPSASGASSECPLSVTQHRA
jgi:ParB family transcriptional regulator, chromosome partitioning protein